MKKNNLKGLSVLQTHYVLLWVIFFVIGLIWLLLFIIQPHIPVLFPMVGSDAYEYGILGHHLATEMSFTRDISHMTPEVFRAPGYPALVAIGELLFGTIAGVIILQIFLWSVALVLLYDVLTRLFTKKIARICMGLLLVYPSAWYLAIVTLTEILFTVLLILLIYTLYLGGQKNIKTSILIGILLGLLTLTRPGAMYFPIVIIGWVLLQKSMLFSIRLKSVSIVIIAFLMVISPWILRNYLATGHATVSSVGEYNIGWYNTPLFIAYQNGTGIDFERKNIRSNVSLDSGHPLYEYPNVALLGDFGKNYIREHFFQYAFFHSIKTIPFFVSDSFRDGVLFYDYQLSQNDSTQKINFGGMILAGQHSELIKKVIDFFLMRDIFGIMWTFGLVFWFFVSGLSLLSLGVVFLDKEKKFFSFIILLWFVVAYFAAITGPVSFARYRFPVEFIMMILAIYSGGFFIKKIKSI